MKSVILGLFGGILLGAGCGQDTMLTKSPSKNADLPASASLGRSDSLTVQDLSGKAKAAAQQKNWAQAITYLTRAQNRAYLSPQIMFNLATAHSQVGNEVLASLWFRTYLAAAPDAANAGQVGAEIERLEKESEIKMQRLYQQAEQLADQLPVQGDSENADGRRADAFKRIAISRMEVGDFSGADEDLARGKQFTTALWRSAYEPSEDFKNSQSASALAGAGDVAGAVSAFEKIKNQYTRNEAKRSIFMAMLRSGDIAGAKKMLQDNYLPDEYYIGEVVSIFADQGDMNAAMAIAEQEKGDPRLGYMNLAERCLEQHNIPEAVRLARLAGDSTLAMAIRGEAEAAFNELMRTEASAFEPESTLNLFNDVTGALIQMGDLRKARRSAELAFKWLANEKMESSVKEYQSGFAQIGKAYLDVESGKSRDVLVRIRSAAAVMAGLGNKAEQPARWEGYDLRLRANIGDFAILRGQLTVAEDVADSFVQSREKVHMLERILKAYDAKRDGANVERLKAKLAGVMDEARLGWSQGNFGRATVVEAWLDCADALKPDLALNDLQAYLLDKKNSSPEYAPVAVAAAASQLGLGLARIRALNQVSH